MLPALSPAANITAAPDTILQVDGLKKYFGGVKALDGVTFSLQRGEVHALVGENGAGKSTLIKILSGVYAADDGQIKLNGSDYHPDHPHEAKTHGVQVVHQEFNLLSFLSVAENISIEAMPRKRLGILDRTELRRRARTALDTIGLSDISVDTPVQKLGIAHRQLIEIARALQTDSSILILDEPTATLTERETSRLFQIIQGIKARGVTIVFVSHHLDEVFAICDRVTIFRSGKTIATELISQTTPEDVVRYMVGRELASEMDHETAQRELGDRALGDVVLRVSDLVVTANKTGPNQNGQGQDQQGQNGQGISFDVRAGEIVGIAGLVGAGRTDVLRGIFAADPIVSGRIECEGKPVQFNTPNDAIMAGIGFVSEDRKDEGLILDMSIAANISLANMGAVSSLGLLRFAAENDIAHNMGQRLKLKHGKLADPVSSLSGGNQQKVVLAKWLARFPRILMLDEPTRGVDVGAKAELYAILRGLAREGVALLIVSSEMPELMTLCDRIIVMAEHRISGTLNRAEFSEEKILQLAYGQVSSMGESQ